VFLLLSYGLPAIKVTSLMRLSAEFKTNAGECHKDTVFYHKKKKLEFLWFQANRDKFCTFERN